MRNPPAAPVRRPRVSVVVPCFDYARYLPTSVGSALSQEGVEVEVVVVDDCSRDDSLAVARRLAAADPRVTVVAHRSNAGPVATFNDGLAVAGGEYLVRLDADDALTPGSLARATALAESRPEVGMVYGAPLHFSGETLPRPRTRVRGWTVWSGPRWLELRCRLGVNCITSPEVLMRMDVVREVGGQRELAHTHDMEMWMRLARAADVGHLRGPDQAWHREHGASRSARAVDVVTDLHERAEAYTTLFEDGLGDPGEDRRLLALARTALADEAVARVCQAYVRGWAGDAVTDAYLAFAAGQVEDLDRLPHGPRLRRSVAAGTARARYLPGLLLPALVYRARREVHARRWRGTGL
ncbi:glycosyltransferase family 2 protein [Geodermatophilus sp. SYSU D01045]